jgi:enoyl-CoA hydratase/carnithine racemase
VQNVISQRGIIDAPSACRGSLLQVQKARGTILDNPVSLRRDGSVAIITIDNPPVNALRHGVRKGILDCVTAARDDVNVEAIVLTGAGRTFVAGADITEFGKPSQPA